MTTRTLERALLLALLLTLCLLAVPAMANRATVSGVGKCNGAEPQVTWTVYGDDKHDGVIVGGIFDGRALPAGGSVALTEVQPRNIDGRAWLMVRVNFDGGTVESRKSRASVPYPDCALPPVEPPITCPDPHDATDETCPEPCEEGGTKYPCPRDDNPPPPDKQPPNVERVPNCDAHPRMEGCAMSPLPNTGAGQWVAQLVGGLMLLVFGLVLAVLYRGRKA